MLDSDAAPQPGWLENLIKPFADPEIMAVGGFTVLGYDDLLSKTFALGWIFDLARGAGQDRQAATRSTPTIARSAPISSAPTPSPTCPRSRSSAASGSATSTAKRLSITLRTADAMTVHAPHPGYKFLAWRAWTMGLDRDYQAFQTATRSRLGRLGFAFNFFGGKVGKSWWRIWTRGQERRPARLAAPRGDGDHPRLLRRRAGRRDQERADARFRAAEVPSGRFDRPAPPLEPALRKLPTTAQQQAARSGGPELAHQQPRPFAASR